jgi:hypothetical protein
VGGYVAASIATDQEWPIPPLIQRVGVLVACVALSVFYVVAASEHGRRVNTSKARGDQTGYLWDAENVYANWHGKQPPVVIGERNRMPLYAGYLALFYHPDLSDPAFFEVAKRANIYLSLALLAVLAAICFRELPALVAANLTGIMAFGIFIFKAGYAQSELLFYFLMFVTFLGCWHLLRAPGGWRAIAIAAATGVAAGLAQLTKAAMLPFVGIFLVVYGWSLFSRAAHHENGGDASANIRWRLAVAVVFTAVFFAVLWPYLSTSKRVFGHYFYNVNSTFYVWYDDWAHASVGTYAHGDGVGWPAMPDSELPGAGRYLREHTVGQIVSRIASGFEDMAAKSVQMYEYLPYLLLYVLALLTILATRRALVGRLLRSNLPLVAFLIVYAVVYVLAIAFYYPTSGTGTARFLLAHLAPLFFAMSFFLSRKPIENTRWQIGALQIGVRHFHGLVFTLLAVDVAFHVWPRLMTTYGGF